ncbi:hypothetical protein PV08_05359 [Exophiala spinifera]|uniref:NmrA-like domain-containing protein n=1 Tax=Exophiala spinifera TaxID=91928 RepID=A0A0D2BVK2_9EURO|nr:uncharacterized protein PV08_05359 [Exophiala spinifera]KIW15314.1 hypothetical protein PV08_05359 [Exophiala spinifera]
MSIFVVGATGIVGGAVARHLLSLNWAVHATTRNPDSKASKALQALGAKLFKGTWDDERALLTALAGCSTLFLNPYTYPFDQGEEVHWSNLILTTAKAAGVKQVVFTSIFGTQNPEKLKYQHPLVTKVQESKGKVEQLVRAAGFDFWTILRPGYFMASFLLPKAVLFAGFLETGRWTTALLPESPMPLIDEHDIAVFTAAALADKVRFNRKEIELSGELRNPEEITKALSGASGREIKAVYLTAEEVEAQEADPLVGAYLALRDMHLYVDIDQVKAWGLPIGTFEAYLARKNDVVQETYGLKA